MASTDLSSSASEEKTSGSEYEPDSSKSSDTDTVDDLTSQYISKNTASQQGQNNLDEIPGMPKGKKRIRNPRNWKRNIKKKILFVEKNKRREIPKCRCNCSDKLSTLEQTNIFNKYSNLATHAEQTIYLQGCIKKKEISRSRPRSKNYNPRKRAVYEYQINTDILKSVIVCQNAFLAVHGIFKSRLEKKVKSGAHPKDNRGCHSTRPNRTSNMALNLVRKFISELPARESHYTRSDSRNRKYLDPNLSITKLHDDFSKNHPDNKVSYGVFSKIFNEEFNITFGYPRKDICNVCTKFLVDITKANMESNENTLRNLKIARELHLRKAEVFKSSLSEFQKESTDITEMVICFDFEKNLPLPVTNAQDEYYVSQLWLHVFGIHNLRTHKATMYAYTENFALKGPNEVITCLSDYIEKHKDPQQNKLKLFCDNAFSQNKNRFLFTFLDQLCKKNVFNHIEVVYPVPGHSMMPIDRDFAAIEKARLKLEKVDNPETYVELIKSCRKKNPFDVVFLQHSLRSNGQLVSGDRILKVLNFKDWVEPYAKASVPRISKTRFVVFETGIRIVSRETMTGLCSEMPLYKVGMNRKINSAPKLAYGDCYLKIKVKKFESVKKLLNLVTSCDIEFYKRTLINSSNIATPSRKDTGNDDEHNVGSDTDIYE